MDKAGAGVADVQVWFMGGRPVEPETVATVTTDGQGRFLVPWAPNRGNPRGTQKFSLLARARDGRVGWLWLGREWPNGADGKSVEVELGPVGDVRGRLTDQNTRPIAGVEVKPVLLTPSAHAAPDRLYPAQPGGGRRVPDHDRVGWLVRPPGHSPRRRDLRGDCGPRLRRARGLLGHGPDGVDRARQPPGADPGPAPAARCARSARQPLIRVASRAAVRQRRSPPFELVYIFKSAEVNKDGAFQFDGLPPGRYVVNAYFDRDGIIAAQPEHEVEVGPGAVAQLEIPLQRLPKITGRVVDAHTGKGIAGVRVESLSREMGRNLLVGEVTTDAEGRYTIAARPGKTAIELAAPMSYLGLDSGQHHERDVKADQTWPELKLAPATDLDGIVVDEAGHPVNGAEVFIILADRRDEPIRTGPGGTFHFDWLDPDDTLPLWARSGDATTNGTVVVKPKDVKGKVTLTVDPKYAVRIRGLATDASGKRVAGAQVTLWWNRPMSSEKAQWKGMSTSRVLESYTTGDNGWFVFRGLWPGLMYNIVIEARGHNKAEAPRLTGKAGETHDVGKIVLINTSGHLAGRVVGTDGRPIPGAAVFNRGDGPQPVATSTDPQGRFRLEGLFPGTKYAFVRKDGFRFTGLKADADADDLTITLLKTTEPPPAWKPGTTASFDEQAPSPKRS